MCGIFSILNNENNFTEDFTNKFIMDQFLKGKSRGPEYTELKHITINCKFGFHRLAINGLNTLSNQPLVINEVSLICNGEIYNYEKLYEIMGINGSTGSDCEIIIHLYIKYGIEQTLQMLDGVFAFILCDHRLGDKDSIIFIARDPFGVRPLYKLTPHNHLAHENRVSIFASEIKMLSEFYNDKLLDTHSIEHFQPGTYSQYTLPFQVSAKWKLVKENVSYDSLGGFNSILNMKKDNEDQISENIQYFLINAIKKRISNTERPIACLLSGGFDSSLITALVSILSSKKIDTYSIGLKDSEDLRYAKIVATYLGTNHTEIIITEQMIFDTIPEVILTIESYDITTVRASIGNYLLGKYISENSEAKVIFNGDGSDEVSGGYLYMNNASDCIEFDKETRRLLKDIHKYDVLRSDRCISCHGLEPRTPFLDRSFVNYYLSIDPSIRFHTPKHQMEKHLIRNAFCSLYYVNKQGKQILPYEILWRKKETFSDGISKTNSISQIVELFIKGDVLLDKIKSFTGDTLEQKYYRYLFDYHYPNTSNIIKYMWMPKYMNATDPSARVNNSKQNINKIFDPTCYAFL